MARVYSTMNDETRTRAMKVLSYIMDSTEFDVPNAFLDTVFGEIKHPSERTLLKIKEKTKETGLFSREDTGILFVTIFGPNIGNRKRFNEKKRTGFDFDTIAKYVTEVYQEKASRREISDHKQAMIQAAKEAMTKLGFEFRPFSYANEVLKGSVLYRATYARAEEEIVPAVQVEFNIPVDCLEEVMQFIDDKVLE